MGTLTKMELPYTGFNLLPHRLRRFSYKNRPKKPRPGNSIISIGLILNNAFGISLIVLLSASKGISIKLEAQKNLIKGGPERSFALRKKQVQSVAKMEMPTKN